jgi:hypothetical protein
MYNDFLGTLFEPTEEYSSIIRERADERKWNIQTEYDYVRTGLPSGTVKFQEVNEDRKKLLLHFTHHGYDNWPYSTITERFRKHVALFRANLDFWEEFSKNKVFPKDEIYYRCLSEGPSFTERIKKTRATCYRAFTTETQTDIEEEYYSDRYDGYNSIIHEKYLIHWDDREDISDIKYAFIPTRDSHTEPFRKMFNTFWDDFKISDNITVPDTFDQISALRNTKMYDTKRGKTSLMREFWGPDIRLDLPYYAKRAVVLTSPGSTRDTGIGDPSTILRVKMLNAIARSVSEITPYSANADGPTANSRYKRVLRNNLFLHLDFKKFGLTFPRALMNVFIEEYGKRTGIDTSCLIIRDFYVEIDGETFSTERGTMLGWLDSINSLCVSIILHTLGKELKFDHVTFNDDVEISKKGISSPSETLELLRGAVITTLDKFDIPISMSKTFGSKASVFLERYAYYSEYGIDMYKEQLTVAAYAKSCVTREIWQAKFFFGAANQWTKSKYAEDRCIDTCPIEFRKEEKTLPLWSGGWYITRKKGLDMSLRESDRLGIILGMELSKYKPKKYATRIEKVSSGRDIAEASNKKAWRATSAREYRAGVNLESINELNDEVENVYNSVFTRACIYAGRNQGFATAALILVENLQSAVFPGGGSSL